MATETIKQKLVALVTTEVFTPYKAGEVFCVPEEDAAKLLTTDKTRNEYGVPRYPKVKVRLFNPQVDADLLLKNHSLNVEDHNRLLQKLHPDRPLSTVRVSQFTSEITEMLDEIDPTRGKDKVAEPKAESEPVASTNVVENPPRRRNTRE